MNELDTRIKSHDWRKIGAEKLSNLGDDPNAGLDIVVWFKCKKCKTEASLNLKPKDYNLAKSIGDKLYPNSFEKQLGKYGIAYIGEIEHCDELYQELIIKDVID